NRTDFTIAVNAAAEAHDRGDVEKEERYLLEALRIEPENSAILESLATLYVSKGWLNRAIPLIEKAIEVDPKNPAPLNNLAWLLATARDVHLRDAARSLTLAQRVCTMVKEDSPDFAGYLD